MAFGKSPSAGSVDPTRWNAAVVAMQVNIIFTFVFNIRILRHAGSGRGTTSTSDPQIDGLGEVSRHTMELRGAPPRERKQADSKHRTDATIRGKDDLDAPLPRHCAREAIFETLPSTHLTRRRFADSSASGGRSGGGRLGNPRIQACTQCRAW